ncbi:MAG: hypothetical protein ACOCUH_02685 [Bacteriovoracia bacterium]
MFNWNFKTQHIHSIVLYNETSQTSVLDCSKIHLLEIHNQACVLKLPKGSCAQGHMITFYISKNKNSFENIKSFSKSHGIANAYSITGKVSDKTAINQNFDSVTLQFTQFVASQWKEIEKHYNERQGSVNSVLAKLKGYQ